MSSFMRHDIPERVKSTSDGLAKICNKKPLNLESSPLRQHLLYPPKHKEPFGPLLYPDNHPIIFKMLKHLIFDPQFQN
jgi:hypothetical protein